jgi:hypothetical protein
MTKEKSIMVDDLMYVYHEIYSKAEYCKQKEANSDNFNAAYEAGVLYAFSESLEVIRMYIEQRDINFMDYIESPEKTPYSVAFFKPKGWPVDKPLLP